MDRTPEHIKYIEGGGCPSITPMGTWCNGKAGHLGPHFAQRIPTPGQKIGPDNPARVEWT